MADALLAENKNPCSESSPECESVAELVSSREANDGVGLGGVDLKSECPKMVLRGACGNSQAWRPDDAFRPQSLPNLSNPNRHYGGGAGGVTWGCNKVVSMPTSCPICYEDLDLTDSSFLPCLCGFRLYLFCHRRILKEDGRCPGCRKPYEAAAVLPETSVHGGLLFPVSLSLFRGWVFFFFFFFFFFLSHGWVFTIGRK